MHDLKYASPLDPVTWKTQRGMSFLSDFIPTPLATILYGIKITLGFGKTQNQENNYGISWSFVRVLIADGNWKWVHTNSHHAARNHFIRNKIKLGDGKTQNQEKNYEIAGALVRVLI